jgi:hypothetical protein
MHGRPWTLLVFLGAAACATPHSPGDIEIQREAILAAHPEWPAEVVADIRGGQVALGMTREQVLAALGPPRISPPIYPPHDSPALGSSGLGRQLAEAEAARWRYDQGGDALYVSFCEDRVCRIHGPAAERF